MLLPVGRSFWAIAAGYAGLFAVLFVPAPIALILGIIAIYDIKRHPDRHGMGRAIFGLVMGAIFRSSRSSCSSHSLWERSTVLDSDDSASPLDPFARSALARHL
jgi:hypothetical protein